jgi:hypothetical protein
MTETSVLQSGVTLFIDAFLTKKLKNATICITKSARVSTSIREIKNIRMQFDIMGIKKTHYNIKIHVKNFTRY